MGRVGPGWPPIVAGISYERLDAEGGIQWPCPTPDHPGTRYLYETDFPRGPHAKFVPFEQGPAAEEMPSERFPLILNTGRVLYHWHGGTMTTRAEGLLAPDAGASRYTSAPKTAKNTAWRTASGSV